MYLLMSGELGNLSFFDIKLKLKYGETTTSYKYY